MIQCGLNIVFIKSEHNIRAILRFAMLKLSRLRRWEAVIPSHLFVLHRYHRPFLSTYTRSVAGQRPLRPPGTSRLARTVMSYRGP